MAGSRPSGKPCGDGKARSPRQPLHSPTQRAIRRDSAGFDPSRRTDSRGISRLALSIQRASARSTVEIFVDLDRFVLKNGRLAARAACSWHSPQSRKGVFQQVPTELRTNLATFNFCRSCDLSHYHMYLCLWARVFIEGHVLHPGANHVFLQTRWHSPFANPQVQKARIAFHIVIRSNSSPRAYAIKEPESSLPPFRKDCYCGNA